VQRADDLGLPDFFSPGILRYFTQTGAITPPGVFSSAFPGHMMRVHLLKAHGILVMWAVTQPSTNRAQRCLTEFGLRSGSSNCCCRLLLEECIVCADFSSTSRDKGVFFRCWVCIKAHRKAWHHSINRNGPRPRIIVLERRGDSRPLRGQKEEKREEGDAEEEDLKPVRLVAGQPAAVCVWVSFSLSTDQLVFS
jgi:hypothetical protein